MLRSSLFSASAFALLCVTASAQETIRPQRITSPIKDRGTFQLATGTWLPAGASAANATDVLYNNSAASGYFFGATPVWDQTEEGRIPSSTSPGITGNANNYNVDCYQIGYCSNIAAGGASHAATFYNSYVPCSDTVPLMGQAPTAAFLATGLPAGTATGGQGCWLITFDLTNVGGLNATFNLSGDANGSWNNDANMDSFGWTGEYPNASGANGTGPIISGNCAGGGAMASPPQGFGTKFAGVNGASDATGLGQADFFWLNDETGGALGTNANGGCFFFGGCNNQTGATANPWGGFYMVLFGTKTDDNAGLAYCSSRVNASGGAARLTATGDPNASLVLTSRPVPNSTGQFFFGPMMLGGALNLGDGLRCVGGMTVRILPFVNAGMMMQLPNQAQSTINYTAPYAASLTGTQFFQHWFRSTLATGTGSNTSDAVSVTF